MKPSCNYLLPRHPVLSFLGSRTPAACCSHDPHGAKLTAVAFESRPCLLPWLHRVACKATQGTGGQAVPPRCPGFLIQKLFRYASVFVEDVFLPCQLKAVSGAEGLPGHRLQFADSQLPAHAEPWRPGRWSQQWDSCYPWATSKRLPPPSGSPQPRPLTGTGGLNPLMGALSLPLS